MDEISIHYYSPQHLPAGYNDIDVYRAAVAAPVSVGERLKSTQSIISETGEDIKIAVTEYNAMYFNSLRHRTRSMELQFRLLAYCIPSWRIRGLPITMIIHA